MKIAQIVCTFPPYKGGIGNHVFRLAQKLSSDEFEVTVFSPLYNPGQKDELEKNINNFQVRRLKPFFSFGNAAFVPALYKAISEYDIVHLHYPFYGSSEIVLLKLILNKKIKLITHYHMDTVEIGVKGLIFKLYRLFLLPLIIKRSDKIICASLDYAQNSNLGKYLKKYLKKFAEIPFGVDIKKYSYSDNREKYLLFVGGLDKAHYFKGLNILIQSFKEVVESFGDYKLKIVGRGDRENYYKELVIKMNLESKVEFIHESSDYDLIKIYQKASLIVLPSINKNEAFGIVLLEAMSTGCAVIASNLPGVRSVFKNNEDGFLVEPGSKNDLTEKICALLKDDNLRKKMGLSARALCEAKYNESKLINQVEEIYKSYRINL